MNKTHRALKLAHHRHTARPLAHHHTSYRALFLILAVLGLSMLSIQFVSAETYSVTATVPGDTLTAPAVISSPTDGTVTDVSTIEVSGTCQNVNSGTLVTLFRNGSSIGSAICQSNSTFLIGIALVVGDNTIIPQVETGDGNPGPTGQAVHITYRLPVIPPVVVSSPNTTTQISTTTPAVAPTLFSIKQKGDTIIREKTGHVFTIQFTVSDGTTPYMLTTNWGDGHIESTRIEKAGVTITLTHTYTEPGVHTVVVEAVDSRGQKALLQFIAYAQGPLSSPVSTNPVASSPVASGLHYSIDGWAVIAWAVWMSYLVICAFVVLLWFVSPTHTLLPRLLLHRRSPTKGTRHLPGRHA